MQNITLDSCLILKIISDPFASHCFNNIAKICMKIYVCIGAFTFH